MKGVWAVAIGGKGIGILRKRANFGGGLIQSSGGFFCVSFFFYQVVPTAVIMTNFLM